MHSISKHMHLLQPTKKISDNDCSFWQYKVYADIRAGFLGDEASNDSGVIENVDFQGFQTLRLRYLRKRGQHYYTVVLSPFH